MLKVSLPLFWVHEPIHFLPPQIMQSKHFLSSSLWLSKFSLCLNYNLLGFDIFKFGVIFINVPSEMMFADIMLTIKNSIYGFKKFANMIS
jgi:hypothetical protein